MVKSIRELTGDERLQEQFAMQLVAALDDVFRRAGTRLWLRPYRVVSTGPDCGLIEMVFAHLSIKESYSPLRASTHVTQSFVLVRMSLIRASTNVTD